MPQKRYRPQEIIAKLRQADVLLGEGKKVPEVVKAFGALQPEARPHRGLQLLAPESAAPVEEVDSVPDIQRRDLLGGLIHEYKSAA